MLGIALIILLGYLVYHYRPKKLVMETKFKNALLWSEWGKRFSIGQTMLFLGILSVPQLYYMGFRGFPSPKVTLDFILWLILLPFNIPPAYPSAIFYVGSIFLPLFFSLLIHRNLIKPLSKNRIPGKETFHFLFGTGLFSVILFGTFICGIAYMETFTWGISALFSVLSFGIPFCLIFFIAGVLAVGIAGHELRPFLTTNPTL